MANVRSKLASDRWHQCHRCGSIYVRYQVKQEPELDSLVKPGGPNRGLITGVPVRKFDRTGRGSYAKKKREQDLTQYKEEDINDALRKGAKLVSYTENWLG